MERLDDAEPEYGSSKNTWPGWQRTGSEAKSRRATKSSQANKRTVSPLELGLHSLAACRCNGGSCPSNRDVRTAPPRRISTIHRHETATRSPAVELMGNRRAPTRSPPQQQTQKTHGARSLSLLSGSPWSPWCFRPGLRRPAGKRTISLKQMLFLHHRLTAAHRRDYACHHH